MLIHNESVSWCFIARCSIDTPRKYVCIACFRGYEIKWLLVTRRCFTCEYPAIASVKVTINYATFHVNCCSNLLAITNKKKPSPLNSEFNCFPPTVAAKSYTKSLRVLYSVLWMSNSCKYKRSRSKCRSSNNILVKWSEEPPTTCILVMNRLWVFRKPGLRFLFRLWFFK